MTSHTTRTFRDLLAAMPDHVQRQARDAYVIFEENPSHPGLRFKQVNPGPPPVYSARVSIGYRALATVDDETVVWFWIGAHADYDRFLKQLQSQTLVDCDRSSPGIRRRAKHIQIA